MEWEGLQTNGMITTVSEILRRLNPHRFRCKQGEVRNQLLEISKRAVRGGS